MHKIIETDQQAVTIYLTIECSGVKRFRVWCEEYQKQNSKYAEREITVDKKRTIFFSLPVTPKELFIACVNVKNPADKDFIVSMVEAPLSGYDIELDGQAREFIDFATKFSQTCGYTNPSQRGTIFKPKDSPFEIKYFPVIIDYKTGRMIGTPARIGHKTGGIEVSKAKFDRYTVPMRIVILLHEFGHVYRNPKIGLPISDEKGADINALYLYLGTGWSKIDAICVFAKVFLKAQSDENIARVRKIQDYIARFENQEYAKKI